MFSEKAKKVLARITDNLPDEVFVRDGDTTFMQFDQLVIKPTLSGVDVEFYWIGKLNYTMHCADPLKVGQTLTLSGLTGRMEVSIES